MTPGHVLDISKAHCHDVIDNQWKGGVDSKFRTSTLHLYVYSHAFDRFNFLWFSIFDIPDVSLSHKGHSKYTNPVGPRAQWLDHFKLYSFYANRDIPKTLKVPIPAAVKLWMTWCCIILSILHHWRGLIGHPRGNVFLHNWPHVCTLNSVKEQGPKLQTFPRLECILK